MVKTRPLAIFFLLYLDALVLMAVLEFVLGYGGLWQYFNLVIRVGMGIIIYFNTIVMLNLLATRFY